MGALSKNVQKLYTLLRFTFQQTYRLPGSLTEGKIFFSGQNELYGVRVEVFVLPKGLVTGLSDHFPGCISDFEIIQRRRIWLEKYSKKLASENQLQDLGL